MSRSRRRGKVANASSRARGRWIWTIATVLFLAGLGMRLTVFRGAHQEPDESIYITLVLQLDAGNGYTLRGSQILEEGMIDKQGYDHPLFFHPPGGIALDWLFYKTMGDWGFAYVQLFSYVVFFWSMMLLAGAFGLTSSIRGTTLVAALSAFDPIMAHVSTRFWLDGPLLAFTTLAVAVFLQAVLHDRPRWIVVAGVLLGYASLIKVVAFLVVPGVALMGWLLLEQARAAPVPAPDSAPPRKAPARPSPPPVPSPAATSWARRYLVFLLLWIVPAIVVQLPWEIWQWSVYGTPFPGWAGKPSASLIENNEYVRYLTVVRSPWLYLTLTPRILWTWIPSLLLGLLLFRNRRVRWLGLSLVLWIAAVLGFHVWVGYLGYSKVLRYIILVVPPSVILFSLLLEKAAEALRSARPGAAYRWVAAVVICVCVAALCLEVAAGISASYSIKNDLIMPILGKAY